MRLPALLLTLTLLPGSVVGAVVGAGPAQAKAQAAAPSPGGQSVGDSLFPAIGNTGYHVRHYGIRVHFRSASGTIRATTKIFAKATHPLSSYSLDLQGLSVEKVVVDGRRASFTRHDHKLVITPARTVRGRFTTKVSYHGRPVTHIDPDGSQDGWIPTKHGATVLSEPLGAMTWFPDNNTPRDKATYSVRINVPSRLSVAGNGDLVSRHHAKGHTTWRWEQRHEQATYLTMISIGTYDVYHSTMRSITGRTIPIWSFIQPKLGSLAAQRRLVPKAIHFEERRFGPYPNTSAGIVVRDLGVGYALETQNRPFFDGAPDTLTLVHEYAHQWYGDSVTPKQWEDIWLNEGFADYTEKLWTAVHGGESTQQAFRHTYDANGDGSDLWRPAPARFSDPADLFGDPVYVRGGMTLQALRHRIGSTDFFRLLHRWERRKDGRSVTTPQFVALAEKVSGRHLGTFFDNWLYVASKPQGY